MQRSLLQGFPNIIFKADTSVTLKTANSNAPTCENAMLYVKELGKCIKPWVKNKSPAVLSLGDRCMKMRNSFIWPNQRTPYSLIMKVTRSFVSA